MQLSRYNKFWVALGGFLAIVGAALADGAVSPTEVAQMVVAALAAFGVFQVTNTP